LNFSEKSIDKTERSLKKSLSFFTKINQARKEDFFENCSTFQYFSEKPLKLRVDSICAKQQNNPKP